MQRAQAKWQGNRPRTLRLEIRCGLAPIMDRVGERHKIPSEQRRCRICGSDAIETAEHLVSSCTAYAELRQECTRRLEALISEAKEPAIEAAIRGLDASLFLSDRFL